MSGLILLIFAVAVLAIAIYRFGVGAGMEKSQSRENAYRIHAMCLSVLANVAASGCIGEQDLMHIAQKYGDGYMAAPLTIEERKTMEKEVSSLLEVARKLRNARDFMDSINYLDPEQEKKA